MLLLSKEYFPKIRKKITATHFTFIVTLTNCHTLFFVQELWHENSQIFLCIRYVQKQTIGNFLHSTSWKKNLWEKVDRFPIFSSHWKMKAKGGLFHMWKLFRHLLYFKDLGIINFLKYASMPILQTNVSRLVKLQIPEVVWIKCGFWKNSN